MLCQPHRGFIVHPINVSCSVGPLTEPSGAVLTGEWLELEVDAVHMSVESTRAAKMSATNPAYVSFWENLVRYI